MTAVATTQQQAEQKIEKATVGEAVFPASMQTHDPSKIAKIYHTHLSDKAKWMHGCLDCNFLCWGRIRDRAYVEVHENRLEMNYPSVYCCCPCWTCDHVHVVYFDKLSGAHFKRATCCTPFHLFCCVECCGEVASTAKWDCCNHALCFCCRHFIPGLPNAEAFSKAASAALDAFNSGKRDLVFQSSTAAAAAPQAVAPQPQTM